MTRPFTVNPLFPQILLYIYIYLYIYICAMVWVIPMRFIIWWIYPKSISDKLYVFIIVNYQPLYMLTKQTASVNNRRCLVSISQYFVCLPFAFLSAITLLPHASCIQLKHSEEYCVKHPVGHSTVFFKVSWVLLVLLFPGNPIWPWWDSCLDSGVAILTLGVHKL